MEGYCQQKYNSAVGKEVAIANKANHLEAQINEQRRVYDQFLSQVGVCSLPFPIRQSFHFIQMKTRFLHEPLARFCLQQVVHGGEKGECLTERACGEEHQRKG